MAAHIKEIREDVLGLLLGSVCYGALTTLWVMCHMDLTMEKI